MWSIAPAHQCRPSTQLAVQVKRPGEVVDTEVVNRAVLIRASLQLRQLMDDPAALVPLYSSTCAHLSSMGEQLGNAAQMPEAYQFISSCARVILRHRDDSAVVVAACDALTFFTASPDTPRRWALDGPAAAVLVRELSAAVSAALARTGGFPTVFCCAAMWLDRLRDAAPDAGGCTAVVRDAAQDAAHVALAALRAPAQAVPGPGKDQLVLSAIGYLSAVVRSAGPTASLAVASKLAAAGAVEAIVESMMAARGLFKPMAAPAEPIITRLCGDFLNLLLECRPGADGADGGDGTAATSLIAAIMQPVSPESMLAAADALRVLVDDAGDSPQSRYDVIVRGIGRAFRVALAVPATDSVAVASACAKVVVPAASGSQPTDARRGQGGDAFALQKLR